jgi:hypothetical protein
MDKHAKLVKTRKYTQSEIMERLKNPIRTVAFEVQFDDDDYAWEDTILLSISVPRVVWKILYGSAVASGITIQDVASEWLSDTAMDLLKNMKCLRD